MGSSIITLAKVKAHKLCPKCKRPTLTRKAVAHDGAKLYDLEEQCTKCSYKTVFENVRVG